MSEEVVVGNCPCGGYGIVYDQETAEEIGECHEPLSARDLHIFDLEKARESELWDEAVQALRDKFERHGQLEEIRTIMQEEGDGHWPAARHLWGGGMQLRNFLRSEGFGERDLGIQNLDNCYAEMIYEAVWEEPAPEPAW